MIDHRALGYRGRMNEAASTPRTNDPPALVVVSGATASAAMASDDGRFVVMSARVGAEAAFQNITRRQA